MLQTYITQVIRTASSYAVGYAATFLLTHFAITIPADTKSWATGLLVFGLGTLYYLVFAALEKKFPQLGWLLGNPSKPIYAKQGPDGAYQITSTPAVKGSTAAELDTALQAANFALSEPPADLPADPA